jgi:PleD family two-component response regulator
MDTPETLLKRADEAVYGAKAGGRNQVIVRSI